MSRAGIMLGRGFETLGAVSWEVGVVIQKRISQWTSSLHRGTELTKNMHHFIKRNTGTSKSLY
jgi:hypothetical protein